MSDTPIIDAIVHAARRSRSWACLALEIPEAVWDDPACLRGIVLPALRAALPWDPPAERLEAMTRATYHTWFDEYASPMWGEAVISKKTWRAAALAAYRADPIMRELYPEQFQ